MTAVNSFIYFAKKLEKLTLIREFSISESLSNRKRLISRPIARVLCIGSYLVRFF